VTSQPVLVLTTTPAGRDRLRALATPPAAGSTDRTARPLAYRHRPALTGPDRCAAVLVTPVRDRAHALDLAAGTGDALVRAALGRVQPGLDLWAPRVPGREVVLYEYVTSDPAGRAAYYRDQEEVSGPAMQELWAEGLVSRFVGIEVTEHLAGHGSWDVLHLTALRLGALPAMTRWGSRFDRHAQAAGHPDMAAVRADWGTRRTMVKGLARRIAA
jgi:hypothetical protein